MYKSWKWFDSQDYEYQDYDMLINYELEQAFQRNEQTYTYKIASEYHTVNFKDMKETNHLSEDIATVLRVDVERQFREGKMNASYHAPLFRHYSSNIFLLCR